MCSAPFSSARLLPLSCLNAPEGLVRRKRSRPTVQKVDLPSHNGEIIRSGRPQIGFSDNYFSSLRLFLMLVGFRKSLPQSQRRNG